MSGAIDITNFLKANKISSPIAYIGSHVQALPAATLKEERNIDIVFTNEGVYALRNLLKLDNFSPNKLKNIKGIGYRDSDKILISLSTKLT